MLNLRKFARVYLGSGSLQICNAKKFTVSVPVISMRHASKPLLASCVPYLQLDRRLVDGDNLVLQRYDARFNEIFVDMKKNRGSIRTHRTMRNVSNAFVAY